MSHKHQHTRAWLKRRAVAEQSNARLYAHLAMHYAYDRDDLRCANGEGNSMAYAEVARVSHRVMRSYLDQLIERGPVK